MFLGYHIPMKKNICHNILIIYVAARIDIYCAGVTHPKCDHAHCRLFSVIGSLDV